MKHNSELTTRAQALRKDMAEEGRRVWYEYLHDHPLRFRRQVTSGNYILDFYCAAANWRWSWMVPNTMTNRDSNSMQGEPLA